MSHTLLYHFGSFQNLASLSSIPSIEMMRQFDSKLFLARARIL